MVNMSGNQGDGEQSSFTFTSVSSAITTSNNNNIQVLNVRDIETDSNKTSKLKLFF